MSNENMEMATRAGALHEVPGVVWAIAVLVIVVLANRFLKAGLDGAAVVGCCLTLITGRIIATKRSNNVQGNDAGKDKAVLPADAPEQGQDPA